MPRKKTLKMCSGVIAAVFVFAFAVFLASGCFSPYKGEESSGEPGMGTITLNLGRGNGRATI